MFQADTLNGTPTQGVQIFPMIVRLNHLCIPFLIPNVFDAFLGFPQFNAMWHLCLKRLQFRTGVFWALSAKVNSFFSSAFSHFAVFVAVEVMAAPLVIMQVATKGRGENFAPGSSGSKNSQAGASSTPQTVTGTQTQVLEPVNTMAVSSLFNIFLMLAAAILISSMAAFIVVRIQRRQSSEETSSTQFYNFLTKIRHQTVYNDSSSN
jgi:hypothetical protein